MATNADRQRTEQLLAEEYDPTTKRHLGDFPQAFTHVALINTASNLSQLQGPAKDRQQS
jgi:GH15 family glucan-1,4-alpha-glucosidase